MKRFRMTFRHKVEPQAPEATCDDTAHDGSEPVGLLESLAPVERHVVACLRLWFDGPDYHETTTGMLAMHYGTTPANRLMAVFESFIAAMALSVDRQICRHAPCCPCLGRDEAVLMTIVRHAALGDRFSASVHASAMIKNHRLPAVIEAASQLGAEMISVSQGHAPQQDHPEPTHFTRAVH
ncbi:MAG: hypothetical protein AAFV19_18620 [Pseudomonadota bacterium]